MKKVKEFLESAVQRQPLAFPYAVFKKFGEDKAGQLAALVAYYTFFSLFPLLLLLVTVLAIVLRNNPELQRDVLNSAVSQFPIIGEDIATNVQAISRSGIGLVIGAAGALWAGLGGVKAMQNSMDAIWDVPVREHPKIVSQLVRGFVMLVVLGAFTLVGTGLAGAGATGTTIPLIVRLFTFPGSLLVNVLLFVVAFKILTVEDVSWRDVLPGAVIAGVAWVALQAVGNYYVARQLKNATATYGMFGIVIGLLSWLYLASQITILAAEVNVVRKHRLWPRSLSAEPKTEADRRTLERHALVEERVESEDVDVRFKRKSKGKGKGKARRAS